MCLSNKYICLIVSLILALTAPAIGGGKLYFVLGSDTGIWEGMDVARYQCHYNPRLFTDATMNAYRVMDPAFRNTITDSYGSTLKMTWWMMAGDIFRFADNTNMPLANTMVFYFMNKYHGASIARWGDEQTLHYHTFAWTEYIIGTRLRHLLSAAKISTSRLHRYSLKSIGSRSPSAAAGMQWIMDGKRILTRCSLIRSMMIIPLSARIPQNPLTTCTTGRSHLQNLSPSILPCKTISFPEIARDGM